MNTKWRILRDDELPEYNIVGPRSSDQQWNCLRCWKNDTLQSWVSKDLSFDKLREHVNQQYVFSSFLFFCGGRCVFSLGTM
jgi:hypothetical protein